MQCSEEEIAEKRRQAQLKLARKSLSSTSLNQTSPPRAQTSTDVKNEFNSNQFGSPLKNLLLSDLLDESPCKKVCLASSSKLPKVTASCILKSEDRFVIELKVFNKQVVDVFKTMHSRCFDQQSKSWSFLVRDHDLLHSKLQRLQPDIVIKKLPRYVLNCCRLPPPDYTKIDFSGIDSELYTALMPFQKDGVCFGIDKGGKCLIADEMGLGKTFQALAIAQYYQQDWPLLIATTASMKKVWEETICNYMPSISVMEMQYMVSGRDYIGDAKILIVSHDMMSRSVDKLLEKRFGVLIVDESHIMKNFKTKVTKAATDIAKKCKRVILLSGTPALSRPSELFTQLSMIDDTFFGSFLAYSTRYCDGKSTAFGWNANGHSNLQELEVILAKRFMIRRTKQDVLNSLPDKKQEVVELDVNLEQFSEDDRKCLNALAMNYQKQKNWHDKQSALLTFFAETARIKIPSVCSYVMQILDKTNKLIIFAHHSIMLDALAKMLLKKKSNFIRIDGSTSSEDRKSYVDKFQSDCTYQCAILSITAANAGLTLTAAQLVIFAELHWTPSILSQAESRAHRIGQEGEVTIKYLIAPGTADAYMWPLLQRKQKTLKEVGLFKDSFDKATFSRQSLPKEEPIAECLNSNVTEANTLDISSYFASPIKSETGHDLENLMNDGLDEIFESVPID